jgi:KAP-like P-loop domain-containing protein
MNNYSDYKVLLDDPPVNPVLGFHGYANALSEFIEHSKPQFAVGIFGEWGSGKTTLMRAIETRLRLNTSIIPVWFNAWRYERETHLIVPLLDTLREALTIWAKEKASTEQGEGSAFRLAMQAGATIAKAGRALLSGLSLNARVPGMFEATLDSEKVIQSFRKDEDVANEGISFYHASFNAMNNAVRDFSNNGARRIVIFVDDLDRCLPASALEVLESMKLMFDLEGFVFVVGLNKEIIERSIKLKYFVPGISEEHDAPSIKGTDYVKKIFQVPFGLPRINMEQLQEYFNALVNENFLTPAQQSHLQTVVRPHLDYLSIDGAINPREVKRFINAYTLQMKMLDGKLGVGLEANVVLALQVMNFRPDWHRLYKHFEGDSGLFQQTLKDAIARGTAGREILYFCGQEVSLPKDFCTYLEILGRPLLDNSLEAYLSSAEATRSTDPGLLKAQALVGALHRVVARFSDGQVAEEEKSDLKSHLDLLQSEMQQRTGPLFSEILDQIKEMDQRTNQITKGQERDQEKLKAWGEGIRTLLEAIDGNLAELRRQASVGTF